jgi:signal transduction histidine kinase
MVLLVAEFFLIGCIVFLKTLFVHFEKENVELIGSLNDKNAELKIRNTELKELNRNIEIQNIEIQAQSTELMQSQESLVEAHHEIERQKAELQNKNVQLEQSLDDKSKDLLHTNQQLIAQNNGLQQFSFTVSHNLRGPVASMLGLINIYHLSTDEDDKASIFSQLEKSVQSLETVIIDLNKIIDIRRDTFNINEKVRLEKEVKQIIQSLHIYITENDIHIDLDFQRPEIFSIKAYINSILYNLISNAIQYRSLDRKSIINISSYSKSDMVIIEISDNGIGIDLNRFSDDLFKLYKRFHSHIEGKGLGLYIVKQQVEKLNGTIEVQSQPDKGTRFIVSLKDNQQNVLEVTEQ